MKAPELTYKDLVKAVHDYHFETRWEVITYCMGFYGEINQKTYDNIQMLYKNAYSMNKKSADESLKIATKRLDLQGVQIKEKGRCIL